MNPKDPKQKYDAPENHYQLIDACRPSDGRKADCHELSEAVNAYLSRECHKKHNHLKNCVEGRESECACTVHKEGGYGDRCKDARFPEIRPCVSITWGDGDCECLETDDVEVLCITVCNCYSNVTLEDLDINLIFVTEANGKPVPVLPSGAPSVQIMPPGPLCFGDIPPCCDGKPGCVSREVVLRARGAQGGNYKVELAGICYNVKHHFDLAECFHFKLCQD